MKLLRDNEEYAVHSRFQSGFNIKVNEFLCFVGNRQNTKLPYGILINEQYTPSLLELVDDRNVSFVWNKEKRQLETEQIDIELRKEKYFSSFLKKGTHKLSKYHFNLLESNVDLNLKTGLGFSLSQLVRRDNVRIEELSSNFQSKEKDSIRSVLLKWIGYGLGLTPAGDDFLVGILFVNRIWPILGWGFLEEFKKLIMEKKYTTDISAHYCISAFQSCYNDALLDMYQALIGIDEKLLKKSIDKVLQFGHTSGSDMMAGILLGLIHGLESYKQN
jgi:hypothetical protein